MRHDPRRWLVVGLSVAAGQGAPVPLDLLLALHEEPPVVVPRQEVRERQLELMSTNRL